MKQRLSPVDWAFLQTESPTRLSHVAGLWIFELPKGHRKRFFREFMEGLTDWQSATPPFNLKVGGRHLDLPHWVEDEAFDIDYHVRTAALPKPGSMEQLLAWVARVHSRPLDRARPLWECYLVEGLAKRRVAIYVKFHHAIVDGVSAMKLMLDSLCDSEQQHARRALWQPPQRAKAATRPKTGLLDHLGSASRKVLGQLKSLPELSAAVADAGLGALNLSTTNAPAPFSAPRTSFNTAITAGRSLAVQSFALSRVQAVGKATGATVNDVVLALCAAALRRYLEGSGELPAKPLVAWVPVSVRDERVAQQGNQIAIAICSLATDLENPLERLAAIQASAAEAISAIRGRSKQAADNYNLLLSGLVVLTQQLGLASRMAPPGNLVVSNVPGSKKPLYLNGAKLVGQYPISMLIDGQALNITVTSHAGQLDFGVVACAKAVPRVAVIAEHLAGGLDELEQALSGADVKAKRASKGAKAETRKTAATGPALDRLVSALKAVPSNALDAALQGERLTREAASGLRKASRELAEAVEAMQAATTEHAGQRKEGLEGPDPRLMKAQAPMWDVLMDRYFRLEIDGWQRLPERASLLIGVHSGGPLTMDAWTVVLAWWRHFGNGRALHGTAHDVLMNSPGLGRYFRRMGVISPTRENIAASFAKGDDVILWPGGEVDSYRQWSKRDTAVLGDRKGFIRLAIREGVPIVPVATVGGHDTLFVLSEGRGIAKALGLKKRLRSEVAPITLGVPFGVTLHVTPFQHIPLPAKIRSEFLEPVVLDPDPARADDNAYVEKMYAEIEGAIQAGMDRLAEKRSFPVFQ